MTLEHGTEEEHRATLQRARDAEIDYIWSGDVRRNPYLAENLQFGIENKILKATWVERTQESGWNIQWL